MKICKITHLSSGQILAHKCKYADSILKRFKGLMFSKKFQDSDGLILRPCNSIHTFFMNFPIDAIFIGKQDDIVAVYRNVRPWRLTPVYFSAKMVLELPSGATPDFAKKGDKLDIKCTNL